MQARRALVGLSLRLCLYVCMSVTGLRLKYTGLRILYVPLWHTMEIEVEESENRRRC